MAGVVVYALCIHASQGSVPSSARWLAQEPRPPYSRSGKLNSGLRQLNSPWSGWIVDPPTPDTLALKRQLLGSPIAHRCSVSDDQPETLDAEAEVCALVADHLRATFAEHAREHPGPPATGGRLIDAARALDEDLVLMRDADGADGGLLVVAATVVFSFGGLVDKLGKTLGAIHEPVPHYAASLERPVDRALGRHGKLDASRGFARANWELRADGTLVHPSLETGGAIKGGLHGAHTAVAPPESLWLRTEYQTLRRLPRCDRHVLFTIRTLTDPLPSLARSPAAAAALSARVDSLSEQMAAYKGDLGLRDPLARRRICEYLDGLARGRGS
jgi:hypothetical protein